MKHKFSKSLIVLFLVLFGISPNLWAKKVYLVPGVWNQAGAVFWVHPYDGGSDVKMTKLTTSEENIYEATVGDSNKKYIFTRSGSDSTTPWDKEWARITKEDGSGTDDNCFIITSTDLSKNNYKTANLEQVTIYYATSNEQSWKVNVARERNNNQAENWFNFSMTKTDKTYNGASIYTATINTYYGSVAQLEFNYGSTWEPKAIKNVWTNNSTFSGKLYDGTNWQTYNYDVTLTFKNGSTTEATETVLKGGDITAPSAPSKTGYTFAGWKNGSTTVNANATISNVQADATYEAQWSPITYTVAYAGNDNTGGSTESSSHTYDVAKNLTANGFTREYVVTYDYDGATGGNSAATATATYTFKNWTYNSNTYTDKQSVTNLTSTQGATVTMTAQWNSGSVTLPTPTKTGYTFSGWYNADSEVGDGGASYTPTADITLTAHWTAKQTTITLDKNEGDTDGTPTQISATYGLPLPAQLESFTAPVKDGYNFKGYYSATSGGTQYYNNAGARVYDGTWDNEAATATFYAQWENAATYSLTVNVNPSAAFTASSGNAENITLGTPYSISATLAEKGYTFTGWTADPAANAEFGNKNELSTTVTVNNGSVTVTANAEAIASNLTLKNNDGTDAEQVLVMHYDDTSLPASYVQPSRTGYDYSGYAISTAPSSTKIILQSNSFTSSTISGWVTGGKWTRIENGTLYACWTAHYKTIDLNKNYTQSASAGYGADGKAKITVGTATATDYKAATRTGHILLGYSVDEEGTTMVIDKDGNFIAGADGYTDAEGNWIQDIKTIEKLYAQWQECMTTVTVTTEHTDWGKLRVGNTGKSWGETFEVSKFKESYQLNATANTGYKFIRWELADGAVLSSGTLTDASIKVKGDSAHTTGTATAVFEEDLSTTWKLHIWVDGSQGWKEYQFTKNPGESTKKVAYYSLELNSGDHDMEIMNGSTYYKNSGTFTKDNCTNWTFTTSANVGKINCNIKGIYTFKVDFSTNNSPKVSVIYPEKYFIAGNEQLTGKNWDVQGTEMTNRSYTFSNLAANTDYRFRITDGTWDQTWGYTDLVAGSDANLATLENNNVHFTLTTAGDVTISIDTDKKVHVTTTGAFGEYRYTLWKIGGMKSDAWSDRVFMKKSGELAQEIAYYEVELAKDNYVFKIKNPNGTYLGNEGEITGNVNDWEFYQYYADGKTEKPNCKLKATVNGTYIFKLDFSNVDAPKVSVTYPLGDGYTATIITDGAGKVQKEGVDVTEVQLYEVYGTALTAVPNDGYHFVGWTTTDGVFIDNNNKSTDSPAYFYATGTGTIKATFAKNPTIYFNNTMSKTWGADEMYVYFYSTDYWDESEYGSGAKDILAGPYAMTQIPRTNIWEYTYDPTAAPFNRTNIKGVVFSDQNMPGYEHFQNCSATYRMDYNNGCANMFVLSPDQNHVLKNVSAKYYKKGFWRNYNSTTSKMYLNIWDCDGNKGIGSYELLTDATGNEAFSAKVNLNSDKRYNIYVGNCTGSNFSQKVEITSENYTGFDLYEYESIDDKSQLAYLTTKSSGDYVFTLTFDDAHMLFSVEYPIMLDDYRVKIDNPTRYSNIIRNSETSGTISMFLNVGTNTFTYEKVTDVNVTPIVWTEDGTITVNNIEHSGVYTMTLSKDKQITDVQPYTGNYYIRTDCAQGGWNEYKTNDNNLMRFTDRNPKFVNNPLEGFNYYYCRWNTNADGNVRFVVANEINACISDTMKVDPWLDNKEFLKGMANIRFGWNSNTNALSRAYISGSYDEETYLRILSNNNHLFEYEQGKTSDYKEITAKKFNDENDWTYTMDVFADGGAGVAVSAKYNNKYQSFVGEVTQVTGEISKTEQLLKQGEKQHLRLVYDFKTDRLISGWTPEGDITSTIVLDADMLLVRQAQGSADQIRITSAGVEIQEIKTIYAVLQLNRDKMLSKTEGILAPDHLYENAIYWFSLPFDVKVNDIFGVDGYGTKWVLQYYDGDKRSKIGFFAETETFWTYLEINDEIKANVGYALCLDPDYFDSEDDDIWANGRESVSFYFPSVDRDLKIVGNGAKTVAVPEHKCEIDRTFADGKKNHKITDTDWNVIGSPAFQDLKGTDEMCTMQALYQWNSATNGYNVATVEGFDFQTTHAYLVQFHGDINWQEASVINPTAAPRYAYADEKNYTIELQFYYGSQWDRTYVALADDAKADFVLNEDLTKMTNSGQPNIYSYAGAYDVAYNATAFENQTVNLGVIARKNGSYTFAMPKDFSGKALLVDLESGEATDLNLSDYTVDLNKGTYNNRFQLVLEVEAKAPTAIDNVDGGLWRVDGKTKKLLIRDQIYLINGGRVYNAMGVER